MRVKYTRPATLRDLPFPFCPGCTHGIIHRLIAECIEELNLQSRVVGISTIGCTVRSWNLFDYDMCQAAHGRAPALGTGLKRASPESIIFTYQGDGDLAAIGMAEVIHAAARGELLTVIFVNNANFGMTGGQMAPTTLLGQRTTTTIKGRHPKNEGYPIRVCELLSSLEGSAYLARGATNSVKNVQRAKKYLKKALQVQMRGLGFSLVELLSACPTNWGMTPVEALQWIEEKMIPSYPLGEFKKVEGVD